jgi:hypothetical protein
VGLRPSSVGCSGWVSADDVSRISGESYAALPRIDLPDDQETWPQPSGSDLHFGLIASSEPLKPPEGLRWSAPRVR